MIIDGALLASQVRLFEFSSYVRVIPSIHQATPLGCAPGTSRFGGTDKSFAVLYAASDLATAIAETVVRDRFEGISDRRMFVAELLDRTAVEVGTTKPLRLIDLRKDGCLKLGISTDIAGAKRFDEAQSFSDIIYKQGIADGILYNSRLTAANCVGVFDKVITSHLKEICIAPLVQLRDVQKALNGLNIQLID